MLVECENLFGSSLGALLSEQFYKRTLQSVLQSCPCLCRLRHASQRTPSFCLRLDSTCRNHLDVRDVNNGAKIGLLFLVNNALSSFNLSHGSIRFDRHKREFSGASYIA